ncbi:MAG: YggS family pyridoxal phosphate-dependent enzyme [Oscillospiraceae bacterium]|nr:YggS family pyridoxal phosphate-dependent enzyme [Oscillospiraceae bacterium]
MSYKNIEDNYKLVSENIQRAIQRSGRSSQAMEDCVRVMAVTKTIDTERIKSAVSCGITLLGESRVQEYLEKKADYPESTEVHFIGGLQSNKVRQIIDKVSLIQSIDSERLACETDRQARLNNLVMDVLIQVNIGGESTKNGVAPNELDFLIEKITALKGLRLRGLMAIPPMGDSVRYFEKMQKLFEKAKEYTPIDTLSMGMSGDYEEAVLFGATIVRLGTALFGNRITR